MKYFMFLVLCVSACCSTSQPALQEPTQEQTVVIERDKKQEKNNAWRDAINEKIIQSFEKSDLKVWNLDTKRNIVLASARDISADLFTINEYYSEVSLFDDGTLFLDDKERETSKEHKDRLITFFNKVKEYCTVKANENK
jgi:hypothetical protein